MSKQGGDRGKLCLPRSSLWYRHSCPFNPASSLLFTSLLASVSDFWSLTDIRWGNLDYSNFDLRHFKILKADQIFSSYLEIEYFHPALSAQASQLFSFSVPSDAVHPTNWCISIFCTNRMDAHSWKSTTRVHLLQSIRTRRNSSICGSR